MSTLDMDRAPTGGTPSTTEERLAGTDFASPLIAKQPHWAMSGNVVRTRMGGLVQGREEKTLPQALTPKE